MKRIITAIGNEKLNNILRNRYEVKVESQDIQYQEGIIEALDKYINVDILILSEDIIGSLEIEELIRKIKMKQENLQIILISNNLSLFKENKYITKVIDNSINYADEIAKYIFKEEYIRSESVTMYKEEKTTEMPILEETSNIYRKSKFKQVIKYGNKQDMKQCNFKKNIITVIGNAGVGKTIFISILARLIKKGQVVIIDFDLNNQNLHKVFGAKKMQKKVKELIKDENYLMEFKLKEKNIKRFSVKIDRNLNIISNADIIFDSDYRYDREGIRDMLEELSKKYSVILIDTSSDRRYEEMTKILTSFSNHIICLVEGNLINIRKTINLLKRYKEDRKNIKLVYNKINEYTLSDIVMKVVFLKYRMIGKLSYDNKYNRIINKNVRRVTIGKNIREEFKKIMKKLKIM